MQSLNGLKKVSNYFIGGSGWQSQEEIGDIYQVHLKDQECRAESSLLRKGLLGSLSKVVFERRTSTGSGLFSSFDGVFAQIFSQIAFITVKKLRNTNFISSRHVKRENATLPVDVRRSKTPLLELLLCRREVGEKEQESARAGREGGQE